MQALIDVILPVFLVIGFGYVVVWRGLFSHDAVDALMSFAQNFAIPCLLFHAISTLDLQQSFDVALLASYYIPATAVFCLGILGARLIFDRPWEDAIAIGFCCLFANSLMLGLAITEKAYGTDALIGNYAIVALHSPFCYGLGITAMEIARARGTSARHLPGKVLSAMFRNALIIGIALGFVVNLSGISLPETVASGLDMMVRAALPVALFGMGGVLARYRPEGDLWTIAFVCAIALILHPAMVWAAGKMTALPQAGFRSAVLTAAMAPGINSYVFANMYGRARRVAASSVLISTALSILTIWAWLWILP